MKTDAETHPQPFIGQNLENPSEEGEKALCKPELSGTPQENEQNLLTWAHKGLTETEPITRDLGSLYIM